MWKSWFAHFSVQGDEDTVPDKPQDMRPRNYSGKDNVNEPEDEEDEEDDDDDDDEEVSVWNLRKSSATALDLISNSFHDDILPLILPHINVSTLSPCSC